MNILPMDKIALLLVFCSVFLFVRSSLPTDKTAEALQKAGLKEEKIWPEDAVFLKLLYPILQLLDPLAVRCPFPAFLRILIRKWLVTSGVSKFITVTHIQSYCLVMALIIPLIASRFINATSGIFICFLIGLGYPFLWLYEKKKKRQEDIIMSMPNVLDTLALTVEAGLDFNAAVKKVCDINLDQDSPLIEEFMEFLDRIKLGSSRIDSLKEMADRIDAVDIYSFCSILIQAEKMGASIGKTLKEQAEKLRYERFIDAEQRGAVASTKLVVPMIFFIFPMIFIVVIGPYVLQFIYR
jgi:tight adherence protein C